MVNYGWELLVFGLAMGIIWLNCISSKYKPWLGQTFLICLTAYQNKQEERFGYDTHGLSPVSPSRSSGD